MSDDLKALSPKDRINALLQLSKFVIPQLKSTEISNPNENEPPKINIIYMGEGKEPNLNNDDLNIYFKKNF